VRLIEVAFAVGLILLSLCGIIQQVMLAWADRLTDSAIKLVVFLWAVGTQIR
jgi:hypothetical protein